LRRETSRQLFHLVVGLLTIAVLYSFGRTFMVTAAFFTLLAGTLLINSWFVGRKYRIVGWFIKRFERRDVLFPGWGSACYTAGILIPLAFLSDINQIAAVIFIIAVGDSFSTMVGRFGKHSLPYNKKKSLEGTAAFFFSSLPSWFFIGVSSVPLAIIGAVVESLGLEIDDNLTIPFVLTTLLLVIS